MSDIGITKPSDLTILQKANLPQMKDPKGLQGDNLRKVAQEFESMFMDLVMKKMRDTTLFENEVEGDSQHVKFYQSMLDTEYTKLAGDKSKIGIADTMVRQMSRVQINGEKMK